MSALKDIRKAVAKHFGSPVTVGKLKQSGGSKTVSEAKRVGVIVAHNEGHDNRAIASAFGYKNAESVANVFCKVNSKGKEDFEILDKAGQVAHELRISPE